MSGTQEIRIFLETDLRVSAAAGKHNFISIMTRVLERSGFSITYEDAERAKGIRAALWPGYTLFHMRAPFADRSLTFRRVYHYPFWNIEQTDKRWNWRVAKKSFPAERMNLAEAERFFRFWQNRLFGQAPKQTSQDGLVYVPLQGRLLDHRSFQSCSPVRMIEHVLEHDPNRKIVVTLHPNETYSPQELSALDALQARSSRLSVETGAMEHWLSACDYVVTQNSAAAFSGYFFEKPAILFAKIGIHHIAANVIDLGFEAAIRGVMDRRPDYAGYIHWFWQKMSINAGRPDAEARVALIFRAAGWPV